MLTMLIRHDKVMDFGGLVVVSISDYQYEVHESHRIDKSQFAPSSWASWVLALSSIKCSNMLFTGSYE